MGSSNMGVMTTGDIEDQQHTDPNWFVNHEYMLRPNQEGEANKLGYFILKVPKHRRQPLQDFSPHGWRFGLHNRENLDSNELEAIKLAIAVQYGLVGEKWVHFRDAIVDDPKAMLVCYGLQNEVTNWTTKQIKHVLALDALFLATLFDLQFPEHERRLWTCNALPSRFNVNNVFYEKFAMSVEFIEIDLCRVENQIPFVLIDKAIEYISNLVAFQTFEDNKPLIVDLEYQQQSLENMVDAITVTFMTTSSEAFKIDNSYSLDGKMHILEVAYKVICGSKGLLMKSSIESAYIHVPSATELVQSGIKLVGVDGPLYKMSYKKNCLCLPKMRIYDETIAIIRNMVWYEGTSNWDSCIFHDYIIFMCDLIQSPKDLDLLVRCDVIDNGCGSKAFEMCRILEEGLIQISSFKTHHDMKQAVLSRCGLRRHRLWSEFKIVFCSKPWLVLSTIAVVLVTMATLVQTYIAIVGSNKMKPKFP